MENTSTHQDSSKNTRLQLRIDVDNFRLLEKAALYERENLSQFVREASLKEAQKVVHKHETMTLSDQDWDLLLDAIENPPKPSKRLKKAAAKYLKTTKI